MRMQEKNSLVLFSLTFFPLPKVPIWLRIFFFQAVGWGWMASVFIHFFSVHVSDFYCDSFFLPLVFSFMWRYQKRGWRELSEGYIEEGDEENSSICIAWIITIFLLFGICCYRFIFLPLYHPCFSTLFLYFSTYWRMKEEVFLFSKREGRAV